MLWKFKKKMDQPRKILIDTDPGCLLSSQCPFSFILKKIVFIKTELVSKKSLKIVQLVFNRDIHLILLWYLKKMMLRLSCWLSVANH